MSDSTFETYLARHGETAWTITHQHTGLTDLPLTLQGERNARRLGERLRDVQFDRIYTSPLQRAVRTCQLAGFAAAAREDRDLVEWNYGDYEGKTTDEIRRQQPNWDIFRDGCPGGESLAEVSARANRVVAKLRDPQAGAPSGRVLLFSHSHFLRVLAARWVELDASSGRCFVLNTAALSIVGYEHGMREPVLRLWNDCRHTE